MGKQAAPHQGPEPTPKEGKELLRDRHCYHAAAAKASLLPAAPGSILSTSRSCSEHRQGNETCQPRSPPHRVSAWCQHGGGSPHQDTLRIQPRAEPDTQHRLPSHHRAARANVPAWGHGGHQQSCTGALTAWHHPACCCAVRGPGWGWIQQEAGHHLPFLGEIPQHTARLQLRLTATDPSAALRPAVHLQTSAG